jgi:hypothetical protein
MQLRKAANHPLLHRHNYSSDKLRHMAIALQKHNEYKESDAALVTEDMEVMTDFELHSLCSNWRWTPSNWMRMFYSTLENFHTWKKHFLFLSSRMIA